MNQQVRARTATVVLLVALIAAAFPSPAYAAISVVSVSPNSVVNNAASTITITGTDFLNGAQVDIAGALVATTWVDAATLTAVIPAGFTPGTFTVRVTNPDATTASLNAGLTVAAPTATPPPTVPSGSFVRPQIAVKSYQTKPSDVRYGQEFRLIVKLRNEGQANAYNVQASFTSSDFLPLKTGGVVIAGDLVASNSIDVEQLMTAARYVYGIVSVDMNLSYSDINGTTYTEKFTLNIQVTGGGYVNIATATPTGVKGSQLVITSYAASIDTLQPGEQFTLTMTVQNTGNVGAQRVTMIVGGGSSSGASDGTPQPGGVSGGGGEFTNFAPVGASNVQTLGDLAAGGAVQASQDLIVNVSTSPGAYPMKITFSYLNDKGEVINDEQVITLLVYSLPNVDVSFYRPPDPFFVGQPGALPLQVVNLGKRLAVLGTLKIESVNGTIENGTSLIGSLDAGGYFTLDAIVIPEQSGPLELEITIDYTDDFNQARTITRKLELEVTEGFIEPTLDPSLENGGGVTGEVSSSGQETVWQKIWRFILGLLGLDSAPPSNSDPGVDPGVDPQFEQPLPAPRPGSGKG